MAEHIDVRPLTPGDLPGAFALSTLMGWNQRLEDWRTLTTLAPGGSFAAHAGGRIVGTAIGIDYRAFGWVAMMLVDPDYRNRGLGARLLESALSALPEGRPVRLDATPLGRPLYERYGFEPEETLTRHLRPAGRSAAACGRHAAPMPPAAIASISELDREVFGNDRVALLQWMHAEAPEYAWADTSHADAPRYCFGRYGRLADHLGPIVATSDDEASDLAASALSHAGDRAVIVDAYDRNVGFVEWLGGAGFEAQRPLYRMQRGSFRRPSEATIVNVREFAILGPEFG